MDIYLVPPSPEFRDDVLGQEFRIASRYENINVWNMQATVQNILELFDELYFVKEKVMHLIVRYRISDESVQGIRIPVLLVYSVVQCDGNDMLPVRSRRQ